MDTEGSDIDVTELDDCLKELEAIDISDLELSDNEQNLDSEKLAAHEEDVNEKTECKPPETSEFKSFLPSSEVERSAEFELEGTAQINFPSRSTGFGENYEMGMSRLPCPIGNETEDAKPKLEFQTNLSVTELREILKSTIDKGILENKNKSDVPVELSDKIPVVVKDSVRLSCGTKREETEQLASTLGQHVSDEEPILSPEITLPPRFSPTLESTPKRKHCQKDNEEDDNYQLDDTTDKVDTIVKQEVPEPVPEDTEVALSENESTALLKRAGSEASLSSCETVIFERRSPLDDQRLSRRPSSDIEEVNLVKSIIQNLEALEACDSLEAISPDSMSSPPPVESVDKAVTAELSENDIDYKKERRKKKRKKKKTKKRHEKKKKGDNEKDGLSDASFSSDDYFELEKKPLRTLNYFAHCSSKKRSPLLKTNDRRSSSGSPNCSLPFPPTRQLSSHVSLRRPPHGCEPIKYEPNAVHYERKLRRDGSSSSPSPSRSRRRHKRLLSAVKKCSSITSRSPTHSPPHRSLHSKYTKKRYEPLRSRSKSPLWKRRYRRRSRSRSFSPHSRKYSTTARRKHLKSSKTSESPIRLSPDLRSDSPLERKISRRLKKLESLKKASRWRSKSRSSSPKIKPSSTKERKPDSECIRDSKSPNKTTLTVISNTPPTKIISESEKQLSSPKRSTSRESTSPKRRLSSSPVAQQPSVCPTDTSQSSGLVGNPETHSENLSKPANPSPEKKVPPTVESRTPTPPCVSTKMDKSEPMDISPTPETKLLKETPHPVLNADFTKLPPVPSLVMQLPSMWSQPPPPGTLPVCDTQKPPPLPGTLPVPYGVQPLPSASTMQHTLSLQSQQQQMHSSFTYSHPQVQGIYQNGSGFGLPGFSQNNNRNNFQQQPLYGCQTFTFPQVPSNSGNPVGHPTQFQSTYDSPVNRQDMSVPPPVYNQSQKYQPNLISHNIAQYTSQGGNHTTPYVMQNPQQVHNIMQSPQNIPQTQIKINVQQVLHPQNTNSQSLNRTSPFASCRDPRLKDINISVSCEAPVPGPSVGTQINTATISNQSSASLPQKVTTAQMPLPGQPPLPPGQPPLPPGQPPLPPGQPPLPPKEMEIEQPPLPKSPPPPSTPPYSKIPEAQDKSLLSSTARPQQPSSLISHLQLNVKKLLPSKKVESVATTSASEQCGKETQNPLEQQPENQRDLNKCVCEKTGVEKKICLNCLYKKKEKLGPASVFSHTPNLSRSVKRPIVVNLLHKRKTQPVTAIVKPNVHEIQTSSSSSEQPHRQETAMTASNSNSPYSETRTHDSTESVPVLAKPRIDKQCADVLNGKSTEIVANIPFPEHQTSFRHVDTSSSHKNPGVKTDVVIGKVSVSHTKGNLVDDSEKGVPEEQIHSLGTEEHTRKTVKNDEQTSEIKESLKDSVVLKLKDIDLNREKSTSFQMKNENSSKNKYLNSIIVGNKWNKKVSVLPRTYRSRSADSMLDCEKQSAKEHAKVPKDDLLPTVGNSCMMHVSNRLGNKTLHPTQKAEGNKDEHRDQQETNYTNKSSSKLQISLSEKVQESDIPNNREISAASADKNSKETVLTALIPNNNGKMDYARLKPSDINLSGIKLECISEEPIQDTSEIKLEHVSEGHTQDISEIKLESVGEGLTRDISEIKLESVSEGPPEDIFESAISLKKESLESDDGCVDLGSLCSIVKTKCHESIKSLNDSIATSSYDKLETEKLNTTTDVSSDNRLKLQNPPIHLNNDVAASVKSIDCISSDNVMCSMGKEGKTNIQNKSFKNENSDPSISMHTESQIDIEHCRKDERMHTAVYSAPVTPENALRRPLNEDSSCVEGGKVTKTVVSHRTLDSLENIQQPTISVSQSKSQEKERGGSLDNVAPKVGGDFRVAHLLHEKSECHRGEVMQQKQLKKILVECEEEKDDRVQRSCLPERSVNINAYDSSDSDVIELPTTIDLCLSDDADDVHEVPVPPKVLPIVDVNNDKPIVLSDSECITVDASPKKEISQTNVKNIDVTPSISSAPLLVPQESSVSVTDSMLPAEQLDKTPCLNSNLCISSMQRKDTSLLPTLLAVPSDDSKQPSDNNRDEVPLTKPDIRKSPPSSQPFITDTLLSQMKPAPRSVKLQHAAVLQNKHMHDELSDLCSVKKMELDGQSAIRDTETKGTPSFSEKNFKGDSLKNKRNFSVLLYDSDNEKNYNAPSDIQQKDGEPCLKKQKQSSLIENDEQTESDQTIISIRDHPKRAQKGSLSVTVLQPINIIPSESREGTLSSQVQRYSSRILRSPQKNTVIFAKYVGSTDIISNEEDCSNEDITTAQLEKVVSKSEKTIKKYPHRSQLPSYAVSRRILISRLRRCPVVLQANLKKMAKLLRQDFKLTQIPLVVLEQIDDLQLEQSKKITQNLELKRSTSRCCCCQVLCRSIATQTDEDHTKCN